MPILYPYTQYGGIWKLNAASAAQGAGTWATPPVPHLLSWGYNTVGQLGIGNTTSYSSPKQVGSLTNWLALAAGDYSSYGIKTDGTLWSWGANPFGELGLGNRTDYSSPKQIGALTNWSSITAADYYSLAIKTDGTLWAWGYNNAGQLGTGNITSYSSPKQVGALTDWSSVSAGGTYRGVFAVKTDGTLWAWGYNGLGNLGLNNTTSYSSPKQVGSLTNWQSVVSSRGCGLAIKTDGTLWSWGYDVNGQLGLGNVTDYSSPKQVGNLTTWSSVTGGSFCSFAIKTDGTLWAWGSNGAGQLGLGNRTNYSSPKQVGSLTNWSKCYGNTISTCHLAIKTDGTLWSWGAGAYGESGLGNTTYYSSPKQVGSLTSWITASMSTTALAIAKT